MSQNTNGLMEQYLRQQQTQQYGTSEVGSETGSAIYGGKAKDTTVAEVPDNISLEEFRHQVKMWIEIDNQVKKMQQLIKEKKNVQKVLSEKVLTFMQRYNIEDLNTKDGNKLRAKVSYSKPTVKSTNIKEKLINYFEHDKETANKVVKAVFAEDETPKVQKVSLRRLKGVRIMNV